MFSRKIKFSLAHQEANVIDCDAESEDDGLLDELFDKNSKKSDEKKKSKVEDEENEGGDKKGDDED